MKKRWASLLAMLLVLTMLCGAWAEAEDSTGEQTVTWDEEADFCEPEEAPPELDEFELGDETVGEEPLDEAYENSVMDEFSQYADIEWGTEGSVDEAGADTPAMGNVNIGDYTYSFDSGTATIVKYNGTAANVTVPSSVGYDGVTYKVTRIDREAFDGNVRLVSVVIPSTVSQIGNAVFRGCTNLSSVTINGDIGDCNSSSTSSYWTDSYSVFYRAGQNTNGMTVTFGSGVTRVPGFLFATAGAKTACNYAKVTKLVLPNTVTGIGKDAFFNCYDLSQISWSSGLRSISAYAFASTGVTTLALPSKLNSIGEGAFDNCVRLTSVTIPASVTQLDNGAFRYCTNLSSMAINGDIGDCNSSSSSSYWSDSRSVFYRAGQNANGMTVTFGNGVTRIPAYLFATYGVKTDGNYAKVVKVNLPQSLSSVGENAFYCCYDLATVYYDGSATGYGRITFEAGNGFLINAKTTYKYPPAEWQHDANGWRYRRENGTYPSSTWEKISGRWYYFNAGGYRVTGWQKLGGKYYYFSSEGVMKTGWQQIGGKYYYFKPNGAMVTGWQQIGDDWYYFVGGGAMLSGWQQIGGKWYCFASGGAMLTGLQTIGGRKFYFTSGGAMATGWQKISGDWYYFQGSGAAKTGWARIGRNWYYFNSNGAMLTGLQTLGGNRYFFQSSGAMKTGWQKIYGTWYYFQGSGAAKTGWARIGRNWYYFNSNGAMQTGWQTLGGSKYYFQSDGAMKTGWARINNNWYYFQASGVMKTGWMRSGNRTYYFNSTTGIMATGQWRINGRYYTFSSNGVLLY